MPKSKRPRLVFQPKVHQAMQRGINLLADAVRPTLGPLPRYIAVDRLVKTASQSFAELLDNGGLIARRIQELSDADADMGAMFMRQLLWQQHERVGDGTAFTAVIFQSIYNQGLKYITAGGNAMLLRRFLEKGMRIVIKELTRMTCTLEGAAMITCLAESVCHDKALAQVLGNVFDVIGAWGQLEIRASHGREVHDEYYFGPFFKSGVLSEHMLNNDLRNRVQVEEAVILLTDLELKEPQDVVPALQKIYENSHNGVLLFARSVSDKVMGVLVSINNQLAPFRVVSVKAPDALHGQTEFIQDLEVLTGGHAFLRTAGDSLGNFRLEDLGAARKIWADKNYVGINGAKGAPLDIVRHVNALKIAYARADKDEDRNKLLSRIHLFMGGAGIVWVGGLSEHDIKARKELTERTAQVIRRSLMSGILPGAGVSLLACRPALDKLAEAATDLDERTAYRILSRAMEEPLRIMLANGGYTPGTILSEIEAAGVGSGFDLHSQQVVDMVEAGIVDSAEVIKTAVHEAIASAALALTIDVLVQHRKPDIAPNP